MEKKNNAQMKALLKLREMVEELINEDFKTNKMPKLTAVKITKIEKPEVIDEEAEMPEIPALPEAIELDGPCEVCGEEDCGCEAPEAPAMTKANGDSEAVSKLKKLLGK